MNSATPRSLLLLGVLLPAIVPAQNVTVTVNAGTTLRTVDERVFGLNATMWDPEAGSAQTVSLLQQAGVRMIRIPGGSLSDEYHWRVNRTLDNTWTWASGMNKFADLITGLNAQAFVTVNYGSGTPEEAAAWVAYANAGTVSDVGIGTDAKGYNWQTAGTWAALRAAAPLATDDGMNFLRRSRATPYGLKYWEIGNECYGSWETDQQPVQWDPFTYATRAKDYITRMKAVDPTIKIGVVVQAGEDELDAKSPQTPLVTNPRTNVAHKGWTPRVLTRLRELGVTPDYVIYHRYEQAPKADAITWGGAYESDAGLLQRAKTWPEDAAKIRQMLSDYLGAAGTGVEILVTENNSVYAKPGKQTTSLVNGLFLADSVGHILQTEIGALQWWDLRNGTDFSNNNGTELYGWRNHGDYGIISSSATGGPATSYEPYPTYFAFKLLSRFARGGDTVVQATSNSSLLTVFAVRTATGGKLNLLVINKDPANALTASIAVSGYTTPAAANVHSYGKPQDDAARPGGSGATDLAGTTMAIAGSTFTATFASYSMTVLSLDPAATPPAPPPPTTPTTPTTPPTPPSSGGGGGGGGAPSLWFAAVLATLTAARFLQRRR